MQVPKVKEIKFFRDALFQEAHYGSGFEKEQSAQRDHFSLLFSEVFCLQFSLSAVILSCEYI